MKTKKITNIPVLVTLGNFVFPSVEMELDIGRAKSIAAINEAKDKFNGQIVVLSQKDSKIDNPKLSEIYHVGTLCNITIKKTFPDDTLRVVFFGKERVKITNLKDNNFYSADAEVYEKEVINRELEEDLIQSIVNNLQYILDVHGSIPQEVISQITDGMKAVEIIDKMSQYLPYLTVEKRQQLLVEPNVEKRLDLLVKDISGQKQAGVIEKELTNKIKDRIDEQQKEYYLREKLRAIKEELGEIDGKSNELNRYLERLDSEPFPENIKERIKEEIARCDEMPQASSEANILRTYID